MEPARLITIALWRRPPTLGAILLLKFSCQKSKVKMPILEHPPVQMIVLDWQINLGWIRWMSIYPTFSRHIFSFHGRDHWLYRKIWNICSMRGHIILSPKMLIESGQAKRLNNNKTNDVGDETVHSETVITIGNKDGLEHRRLRIKWTAERNGLVYPRHGDPEADTSNFSLAEFLYIRYLETRLP